MVTEEGLDLAPFSCVQDACFVRFLGHVTGRAGLAQLAGTFVADPRRNFTINQSVWAQVVQVQQQFTPTENLLHICHGFAWRVLHVRHC